MATSKEGETDQIKDQMKIIGDDLAALTKLVKGLAEGVVKDMQSAAGAQAEKLSQVTDEFADRTGAHIRDEIGAIEKHISQKPLQSALIAFLIGLVFGTMTRR